MTTVITSGSEYDAVLALYNGEPQEWIVYNQKTYRHTLYNGGDAFIRYENVELYDSRSTIGSRPTSYRNLDDEYY